MTGTWVHSATSGSTADLLALRPDLAALHAEFEAQAIAGVGHRLRGLLEARVAQLIGDVGWLATVDADVLAQARGWPTHPAVSEVERAALDLAESFVIDVHSITDEQVQRVQELMGDDGVMALLMNLAILDGFTKMRRVFAEEER